MIDPLRQWVRRLFPAGKRRPRPDFRPTLEVLEDRLTPSVMFAGQQTFGIGANSQGMAVGDFNGDGRLDLVTANQNSGTVSVLLNTTPAGSTTPAFAIQVTLAAGTNPTTVVVGDFNGDGRPDLAVSNLTSSPGGTVTVFLNTTTAGASVPTFASPVTFAVGNNADGLAVADFNGDGRPDLAVTNANDGTLSVLLNLTAARAGVPVFAPQVTFTVGSVPRAVAAADFNGDGRPDLAVTNGADNTVSVLLDTTTAGSTVPSFAAQVTFAVGIAPFGVAAGDFNGDGRPDLAVVNDGTASVLLNTTSTGSTTPTFAANATFSVGNNPTGVAVGDFNGDGLPDLVVTNSNASGTVSVLLNTATAGAASPTFAAQQTFAVGNTPHAVAAADFNGDGRTDMALTNRSGGTASVLLNTTTPFTSATPVVVADFPGYGVYEYNRAQGTWVHLSVSDASLLAADAQGDVAAVYPGYGLWLYRPSVGFARVNGSAVSALAMDSLGDLTVTYTGMGVWEYHPAAAAVPRQLNPVDAALLAMDGAGNVYADFRGYGVNEYLAATGHWMQLASGEATALAANNAGELAANFGGLGVEIYTPATSWVFLSGNQARALAIDANGNVTASLRNVGILVYHPATGWSSPLPGVPTPVAMDAFGDSYADFPGAGLWELDPYRGWYQINAVDVSLLVVV